MKAIRQYGMGNQEFREAFQTSVTPVKKLIQGRFEGLHLKGKQVIVILPEFQSLVGNILP